MIIKKIKLENIRSYLNQELEFPQGSTLLSGDIGSGKTTILLAIEFALFGISKGYLSGSSLLRNGKDKGSVSLDLVINNKQVSIKRTLKKSGSQIAQDHGTITINGKKQELSALELKQAILDLLNYPPESLTKSKSLIYRYTVYTPQEEMKQILVGDKEVRLDILRRVFGIDKYRVIKENAKILSPRLKEKRKELEVLTSTLTEKESQKLDLQESISEMESELNKVHPQLENLKLKLKEKNTEIKEIEQNFKKLNQLKNELDINETNLANRLNERKNILDEIKELEKSIEKVDRPIEIDQNGLNESLSSKNKEISMMENSLKEISYKISEFEIAIKNSEKIKNNISILKKCPVCKQDVSEDHKDHIKQAEDQIIKESQENKKIYLKQEKEAKSVLDSLKKEFSEIENKKYEFQILQLKIKNSKEKELKIIKLNSNIGTIKADIGKINAKKLDIYEAIKSFSDLDKSFESTNDELEKLRDQNTKLEIQKSRLETRLSEINKQFSMLNKEITSQLILKNKLNNLVNIQNWIEDSFLRLIDTIEGRIMLKINADFNELFERWFKMLIESENLNIRLDENFSPVIDQNGYGIEYENLSGGEKTAAALAYRLALNQIINTLVSIINTKDLIILDEPTDGFSEDQLDKIRLVLDELDIKQTIIVSHESKIESFVDTIIKFNKKDHISEIIV